MTWVSQVSWSPETLLCTSALRRLKKPFIASHLLHPSWLHTGGVSSFPSFLNRFFPEVLAGKGKNAYCTYNSQKLQIFTSSYFLAGTAFCCCSSSTVIISSMQPVIVSQYCSLQLCMRVGCRVLHIMLQSQTDCASLLFIALLRRTLNIFQIDENNVNCRRCCWSGLPSAECTPGPEVVHGHCWLLVHYRRCHQLCSSRSGHVVPWTYSPWIWSRIRQPVGKHLPAINYISNQSLDCFCLPSDQCPGISDADSVLCVCLLSFLHCALQAVLTLNTQHSILGAVMQIIKQGIVCSAS